MFSSIINKIVLIQNEKKERKLLEKKQRQQEWVMNSIQEIKRIFPEMVEE